MPANPDFKELLSVLNDEKVEYLVVGAHAVAYYAEPRYTKDLDIWVNPTPENSRRVYAALKRFSAPLIDITADSFADPALVYQMGIPPNRIDIVMGIEAVEFAPAWSRRETSTYDGIPFALPSKADLIRNKRAVGRPQDLLDVARLETSET
jgi:hypothetical protein